MVGGEFGGRCPPQAWKIAEAGGLQSPGAESLQPAAQRVRGEWSFSGVGGRRKHGRAILQILPKRAFL